MHAYKQNLTVQCYLFKISSKVPTLHPKLSNFNSVPLTLTLSSPGMWLNYINMRSKARIEIMVELEARSSVVVST